MNKVRSIAKKVYNLDLAGYKEGKRNFKNPIPEVEQLAKERAAVCSECDMNEIEPIEELAVADGRIPAISGRFCDACGCSLPYLLRQHTKPCKLGKW